MNDTWRRRYRNGAVRLAVLVLVADVFVTVAMGWKAALWLDVTAVGLMILAMILSEDSAL